MLKLEFSYKSDVKTNFTINALTSSLLSTNSLMKKILFTHNSTFIIIIMIITTEYMSSEMSEKIKTKCTGVKFKMPHKFQLIYTLQQ